jgi:hypothetical protein
MPDYRSNTSETFPASAAAPNELLPNDAATLRAAFTDGLQRLAAFVPTSDEQAAGKQRLQNMGAQLDLNIEAAESNPFALQGLAKQLQTWRRGVFALTGDYGSINGQKFSGLRGLGTTWENTSTSSKWLWGLLGLGTIAIGVGFWWVARTVRRGGTPNRLFGVGAVHETKLKLHQTRIPNAKPSK